MFSSDSWPSVSFSQKFGGLALLFICCLLVFAPGQWSIAPLDRDEARFAQSTKQMVASGDYITPHFQHDLQAKKPIGIYWLQSASAAAFGVDSIGAYRLPSFLGGIAAVFLTVFFASLFLNFRQAILSGLFMASSLVLVAESHLAKTDAVLAALVIAQQLFLFRLKFLADRGDYVSGRYAFGFWLFMGLAILVKGPIAPVIAALTIAALLIVERITKSGGLAKAWLSSLRPSMGLVVLTLIVLPWVVLVTSATDGVFLNAAIGGDLLSKIEKPQESHGAPPLAYALLFVIFFWPASFFLGRSLYALVGRWRDTGLLFCLCWLVPFWLVLELVPTKLPPYNLPILAGLAMILTLGLDVTLPPKSTASGLRNLISPRRIIIVWEWFFMAASIALGFAILYLATVGDGSRLAGFLALVAACFVSFCGFWFARGGHFRAVILMLSGAVFFHLMTFGIVLPSMERIQVAPRIATAIDDLSLKPSAIAAAGYHEPSLVFALGKDLLLFSAADSAIFLLEGDDGLALIEDRAQGEFLKTASAIGLGVERIKTIDGYNISKGRAVSVHFYRRAPNI